MASGVYATLEAMPSFNKYVPNAIATKEATKYDLWSRPMLLFTHDCDKSIADAIEVLQQMEEVT